MKEGMMVKKEERKKEEQKGESVKKGKIEIFAKLPMLVYVEILHHNFG